MWAKYFNKLPFQYVTEDGKTVVKVGNGYYEAKQDGSADMDKKVKNGELVKTKVKLVSANGTNPVKISNVAEGTEDTDAVSFKQLKALQNKQVTLSASNAYANGGSDADVGKVTQTLSNGLNFKFKSTDGELLNIKADRTRLPLRGQAVRMVRRRLMPTRLKWLQTALARVIKQLKTSRQAKFPPLPPMRLTAVSCMPWQKG